LLGSGTWRKEGVAAKVNESIVSVNLVSCALLWNLPWVAAVREQNTGEIGLTPRAKRVIELAIDEARQLGHKLYRYGTPPAGYAAEGGG